MSTDPTPLDLARFTYESAAHLIANPAFNIAAAVTRFCNSTNEPQQTLVVLAGGALSQFAQVVIDTRYDKHEAVLYIKNYLQLIEQAETKQAIKEAEDNE